jgi:hypothetical protein
MRNTVQEEIAMVIVEVMKRCLCEEGHSRRHLVDIFDNFIFLQSGVDMAPVTTAALDELFRRHHAGSQRE